MLALQHGLRPLLNLHEVCNLELFECLQVILLI